MPASMAKSSSAGMRKIHRELDRRRKLAIVAKGGVAKKASSPPPPPRRSEPAAAAANKSSAPLRSSPSSISRSPSRALVMPPPPPRRSEPVAAAAKKSSAPLRSAPSSISRSPSRALVMPPPPPAPLPSSAASRSVKRGTTVRVRTKVGTMRTGQCLVLWLSAVVVSAAEDGYLEVIYNGDFPRDDPFRTVRVARDHVKSMPPAFTAPAPAPAPSPTASSPRPKIEKAAPRTTVAGKSLPLLKSLEKKMRSSSDEISNAWWFD